jgi:hypothetical protein
MSESDIQLEPIAEEPGAKEEAHDSPEEEQPEEAPPKPQGRPTEEEKKEKRKEINQRYYVKAKAKALVVEPKAPPLKPKAKARAPKAPPPLRRETTRDYEPSSPKTILVKAYREARIAQLDGKRQKYASWFE